MESVPLLTLALSLLFTGCSAHRGPEAGKEGAKIAIQAITPRENDSRTEIVIEGSDQIQQYTSFQLTEPLRMIVDITDADLSSFKDKIAVDKSPVIDITPSQVENIARLEIALSQSVDTRVYAAEGKLIVELAKPVEAEQQAPAPPAEQAAPAPEAAVRLVPEIYGHQEVRTLE